MRVKIRMNRGIAVLWIVGLVAAMFLVSILCKSKSSSAARPEPSGKQSVYQEQADMSSQQPPEQMQTNQASKYAVRGANVDYRQSYQKFTQTMEKSNNQQDHRAAYGQYAGAYGAYRRYRW